MNKHFAPRLAGILMAFLVTVLWGTNAYSAVLVVNPGDVNAFAEIQDAVDAASPGDVIVVHSGTYAPVLITTDHLTIREARRHSDPVIDAAGGLRAVDIDANGVTVRGMEVRNATEGEDAAYGFWVTGNDNRLIGNTAVDNTHGFGINGGNGGGDRNLLLHNTSTDSERAAFEVLLAEQNRLIGNSAIRSGSVGFAVVVESKGNMLVKNRSIDSVAHGYVLAVGASENKFVMNMAADNGESGFFFVEAATDNTFNGNVARNNDVDGFMLLGGSNGNLFTGSRALNNGGFGVSLDESSESNEFRGTRCVGNANGGSNIPGICD